MPERKEAEEGRAADEVGEELDVDFAAQLAACLRVCQHARLGTIKKPVYSLVAYSLG